jgi:hypothetical protein
MTGKNLQNKKTDAGASALGCFFIFVSSALSEQGVGTW